MERLGTRRRSGDHGGQTVVSDDGLERGRPREADLRPSRSLGLVSSLSEVSAGGGVAHLVVVVVVDRAVAREEQGEEEEGEEEGEVYINTVTETGDTEVTKLPIGDLLWDWRSSRPNIAPPKQWRIHRKVSSSSGKHGTEEAAEDQSYLALIFSNLVSLLVGTGIGVLLYKRNSWKNSNIFS